MCKVFRFLSCFFLLALVFLSSATVFAAGSSADRFIDVPVGNWADEAIHEACEKNITQGIQQNVFGYGKTVKRSEFVKFLVSLMGWELSNPEQGSFEDNQNKKAWYYKYIETAVDHGVVLKDGKRFRPDDDITREEMAVMIVRSLGYDGFAKHLDSLGKPFRDVENYAGYITIAKDLGIVTGKELQGKYLFEPKSTAKREEAVVMLMRLYSKLNRPLDELHAFYAIRSYNQKDFISGLTSVSFGWSSLDYDSDSDRIFLNTERFNNNNFYIPDAFTEPVELARQKGVSTQLTVFASQEKKVYDKDSKREVGMIEYALAKPERRRKIIDDIVAQLKHTGKDGDIVSFDGVVIDFECMKGDALKGLFNVFLDELKESLEGKKLYVAVHPVRKAGQAYYDGYDYRSIGRIADKVILMAHDYNAVALTAAEMSGGYNDTPLSPLDEVYYALKSITDKDTGVEDSGKIWLQISFDAVQWKMAEGKVINQIAFRPDYEQIFKRLTDQESTENLSMRHHKDLRYSWLTFHNKEDNTDNIIWYEDSRSVLATVQLAKLFGVGGISLWRLGNIPAFQDVGPSRLYLDVWQELLKLKNGQ